MFPPATVVAQCRSGHCCPSCARPRPGAVEHAERFAVNHSSIDGGFVERLRGSLTDPGIFDPTVCLSAFLGLGRTLRALGTTETSLPHI